MHRSTLAENTPNFNPALTQAAELKQKRETRPNDETTILQAVIDLAPKIREYRREMDAQKRLPQQLVNELKDAGVFRMTMPESWGGGELDPLAQLRIIEKLAEADASVAWCVMVGCDSGFFSGFIDQHVAKKMYADVDSVTASALTTIGRASKVKGGHEVSGRLPFSSGCHHSDWFVLGCQVYENDQVCLHPNGTPITRQCFVPANAVTILDTWHTTGLRGTGSNDLSVSNVFVPTEQSFSFQELTFYRDGPLYRFPMNILLNFSSVPIGVANAALKAICACGEKPSRLTVINNELTSARTLRDQPFVQDTVGRARAMLASVRAYLYSSVGELWTTIVNGQEIPPEQFADFQLVHTHVFETCTEVVRLLYKVRGGSAVYEGNDLDRCLRDLLAMNQHVVNSLRSYSAGGRILLGLPPEQILL